MSGTRSPTNGTAYGSRGVKVVRRRAIRSAVMERCGNKCVECGAIDNLTLDHIVEASKGGRFTKSNLQILCEKCNQLKSNHPYRKNKK